MEYTNLDATNEKLIQNDISSSSSSSSQPRKGGFRTMPFIIVNECFERVASFGIMPNMILYLRDDYNMPIPKATNFLYTWSAMSNILSIFGAFLSDSYLGRFNVIFIGSLSSLLGLTILWFTAMVPALKPSGESSSLIHVLDSATSSQLAVLFVSLGLISIGAGCVRPCSIAFGADQLAIKENSDDGWKIGLGVPAFLMLISAISFVVGSPFYVKGRPSESLLTNFIRVVVVAIKYRKHSLPDHGFDQYCQGRDSDLMVPTDSLRFLNKACVIRNHETDLNSDGSVSNPWNLCTIGQVESLKSLLRVIPMWSTGIFMMATQTSFSTLQAKTMNRRLFGNFNFPAGSFNLIMVFTLSIVIPSYDRIAVPLLAKYTGRPRGFSCKVRIGIGMLFICAAKAIAAIVETVRRKAAIEQGFEDQPNAVINMSALWLVPEFVLLGLGEAFMPVAFVEFFYTYFSKSMSSFAMAIFTLELAGGDVVSSMLVSIVDKVSIIGGNESWLSTNINKGHLNYHYALHAFLGMINYLYFLVICRAYYRPEHGEKLEASKGKEDDKFDYRELHTS
ncbi:protein NRT1/ PTR FAMILY 1.2-like isoform X2 [Vicia villosa]|uniref:protein NRT1/ PTR FAMILY 1.2-like isoform X2 n=1 Tax=Vicia villosa TaxID=3911 RepID=UPI00273B8148|nr:protein NRT1/ PTR FAMILY 1.2-like isoform X2 [Vicia villosa]